MFGGGTDAYLVKFNNSGSRQWATYYGGTGNENLKASVSCDTLGSIFLSGVTTSTTGIATSSAYQQTNAGGTDVFIAKFNSSGTRAWGSYYGGTGNDYVFQSTNDIYGNMYFTGYTTSTTGIASSPSYQSGSAGGDDAFLVKFNTGGSRLWGTYYGGSLVDRSFSVLCDDSTHVYIAGFTKSTSGIATSGAHLTTYAGGNQDIFLVQFDSSGARQWGTYFGGTATDVINSSLAKGILGSVYFSGQSNSATGVATSTGMSTTISGVIDAFITKFDHTGTQVWGSYFGGLDNDLCYTTTADKFGNVYIGGQSNSSAGIATTGAYQTSFGGGTMDGFLVKIYDCDTPAQPTAITGPATVCKGTSYKYSITAMQGVTSYTWTLPAGWSGNSTADTIMVTPGAINGTISVVANTPCVSSPSQSLAVTIDLVASITPPGYHEICAGDSIILNANTGTNYSWKWLINNTTIAGATNNTHAAKTAGNYTVVINNGSCIDTSIVDTISVNPLPQPIITQTGSDLTTGAYVTYQWYYLTSPITGAVSQTYTPITDGHYAVSVTDTNGCTGLSVYFPFGDVTSVSKTTADEKDRLYPNPASEHLHFKSSQTASVIIIDGLGRQVMHSNYQPLIDIKALSPGIYTLKNFSIDGLLLGIWKFIKEESK